MSRAQAKLRDVVETHVGGKGDLQQPDLVRPEAETVGEQDGQEDERRR